MGIHVEQVMLYGSQANGTAREESDIDLFVISKDWDKYSQRERLEILGLLRRGYSNPSRRRVSPLAKLQVTNSRPFGSTF